MPDRKIRATCRPSEWPCTREPAGALAVRSMARSAREGIAPGLALIEACKVFGIEEVSVYPPVAAAGLNNNSRHKAVRAK